jgi:hypothetical protein
MTDREREFTRRLVMGALWLIAFLPLIAQVTELIYVWTQTASDPLSGVR